jgi:hypothetical protein
MAKFFSQVNYGLFSYVRLLAVLLKTIIGWKIYGESDEN